MDQMVAAIAQDPEALTTAETVGTRLNDLLGRVSNDQVVDDIAEYAGRQCYRSWGKGRDAGEYIRNVVEMGHGSVFEHATLNFQLQGVSRSFTHELVRHSVGTAISQESQRFVDASKINFVMPPLLAERVVDQYGFAEGSETRVAEQAFFDDDDLFFWANACAQSLANYIELQKHFRARMEAITAATLDEKAKKKAKTLETKRANEAARSILPNAAETRLLYSANMRALRHILLLRGAKDADLEINRVAIHMLMASRAASPHYLSDMAVGHDASGRGVEITASNGRV